MADVGTPRFKPGKATARDWAPILADVPLFTGLGNRQLRRVADLGEVVEFDRGDVVTQTGEPGDAMFVVLAGRARVLGKRGAGRVFRTGDFFGEMALLDGEPRSASVAATTELQALKIPHRAFCKLLEKEPKMAVSMLRELAGRIRALQRQASA